MTSRELQILMSIEKLGGIGHPTAIGREMGISPDYAEQLSRHLVWKGILVKQGLKFKVRVG